MQHYDFKGPEEPAFIYIRRIVHGLRPDDDIREAIQSASRFPTMPQQLALPGTRKSVLIQAVYEDVLRFEVLLR